MSFHKSHEESESDEHHHIHVLIGWIVGSVKSAFPSRSGCDCLSLDSDEHSVHYNDDHLEDKDEGCESFNIRCMMVFDLNKVLLFFLDLRIIHIELGLGMNFRDWG